MVRAAALTILLLATGCEGMETTRDRASVADANARTALMRIEELQSRVSELEQDTSSLESELESLRSAHESLRTKHNLLNDIVLDYRKEYAVHYH